MGMANFTGIIGKGRSNGSRQLGSDRSYMGPRNSVATAMDEWHRARPDLDLGPVGLFAALAHVYWLTAPEIERLMAAHCVTRGMFDLLTTLGPGDGRLLALVEQRAVAPGISFHHFELRLADAERLPVDRSMCRAIFALVGHRGLDGGEIAKPHVRHRPDIGLAHRRNETDEPAREIGYMRRKDAQQIGRAAKQ